MRTLVLDTGALIALHRRSSNIWKLLDEAQRTGADVLIPAGTLAESVRGGQRDVLIDRLVARPNIQVTAHDEQRARSAGRLLARTRTSDAIDALVVAEALRHDRVIIATSDPHDIGDLAQAHRHITAVRV